MTAHYASISHLITLIFIVLLLLTYPLSIFCLSTVLLSSARTLSIFHHVCTASLCPLSTPVSISHPILPIISAPIGIFCLSTRIGATLYSLAPC